MPATLSPSSPRRPARTPARSTRILALFALLLVADAITIHGRGPRPISFPGQDVREATRSHRLLTLPH
jgi:hypothetical protein